MTPTPEEKNEIAELAFINNRSFFLREDQKILVRLWEIIQGAVSYHDYDTVNEITPGMVANDEIFTIGNHTILCTEFSASDLEIISEDPEIAHIIAAFNALRGRLDLIYHDHDHYDRVITEANAKKEAASLGDLDDHPF